MNVELSQVGHNQTSNISVPLGTEITLVCSSNSKASFPRWEINSDGYDVTDLPSAYKTMGSTLTFTVIENIYTIRCAFVVFAVAMTTEVCSNTVYIHIDHTRPSVSPG